MSNAAQLVIGVSLGVRFTPVFVRAAPRWLGPFAMIAASLGLAYVVAGLTDLHPASVMLGTSPGGISDMYLTAKMLHLGMPVVTAFHVKHRVAAPIHRWMERNTARVAIYFIAP